MAGFVFLFVWGRVVVWEVISTPISQEIRTSTVCRDSAEGLGE